MKPGGMARNTASTHLGLRRTMTRPFLFCAVLAATAAGAETWDCHEPFSALSDAVSDSEFDSEPTVVLTFDIDAGTAP